MTTEEALKEAAGFPKSGIISSLASAVRQLQKENEELEARVLGLKALISMSHCGCGTWTGDEIRDGLSSGQFVWKGETLVCQECGGYVERVP